MSTAFLRRMPTYLTLALFPLILVLPARAQTFGSITGTVVDPSGAILVGAKVTVQNNTNGVSRTALTNSAGIYSFQSLQPGVYRITVESSGFETEAQENVTVNAMVPVSLSFRMKTGRVQEVIEVSGVAPEIDKETSALGTTLDTREVGDLPINGRDYA